MSTDLAIRDEQDYLLVVREVRSLAERCDTVDDAKGLADRATAAKVYAERAKLGTDMVNRAAAAKLWAERRAGELLTTTVARGGDRRSESKSQPTTLVDLGVTKDQSSRWQRMAAVPAEEFSAAIEEVEAEGRPVTAAGVEMELRRRAGTTAVLGSSESDEWYTPSEHVEAARRVLGGIDLDPASCAAANEVVRADTFYGIDDDGLTQPWHGRVYMNPPYGNAVGLFVSKLVESYNDGSVTGAILLTAARLETRWFAPLFDHLLCFPSRRVKFWQPGREVVSPPFTPAFAYLGADTAAFVREFSQVGPIVRRVDG